MDHTLDVRQLPQVFEALKDSVHRLNSWEIDRLSEWEEMYERGVELSPKQIGCIEKMYLKV